MKPLKLVSCLVLAAWLLCALPLHAQLTVTPLNDRCLVLTTFEPVSGFIMNNLLLIDPDGVVLVDTLPSKEAFGGVDLYPYLAGVVHWLTDGRPVSTLINTSWHFDHSGLNDEFRILQGTDHIVAHWNLVSFLAEEQWNEDLLPFGLGYTPAAPPEAQPTVLVHGLKALSLGQETLLLKTVENAHSGADLVVYLEHSNIVYTGDVYFGGMYPIIDRYAGGTLNGTLHALRQILARIDDDTIVVPSHGAIGTRRSVLDFVHLLETAKSRIRSLIAQGFTEEQVLAAAPMADFDSAWGGGFVPRDLFTLIVYRDLAPGRKPR